MIVAARVLGPELFGILSYGQFWQLLFLPFVVLGTGRILSREIGNDRSRSHQLICSSLYLRIITTLTAAISFALVGLLLDNDPLVTQILLGFCLALVGRGLATWSQHVFISCEKNQYVLRQEVIFRSGEMVFGVVVLLLGGSVLAITYVHCASWWLQALYGFRHVVKSSGPLTFRWRRQLVIEIARRGISSMWISLSINWFMHGPLVFYPFFTIELGDQGQLALVFQGIAVISVLINSTALGILPKLSRLVSENKGGEWLLLKRLMVPLLLICTFLWFLALVCGQKIIVAIFGLPYQLAGQLIGPALFILLPFSGGNLLTQMLVAQGLYTRAALCGLSGVTIMVAAMWNLAGVYGAFGAVYAAIIGLTGWFILLVILTYRKDFSLWAG